MIKTLKPFVVPAYLLLCILLGGSPQGIWANMVLQLLAILILCWAALTRDPVALSPAARNLIILTAVAVLLLVLQVVPLPPSLWSALPGRDFVVEGYEFLGMEPPWLPISLAPYDTLATALALLPPFAVLAGVLRLGAYRENWLVAALLLGSIAGVVLGVLQVTGGDASWYLYRFSAFGAAVGFFANSNHMAALLLVSLPFLVAAAADHWRRQRNPKARSLVTALAAGGAAVLGVGIVINGSSAILLLGAPVAAASTLMLMRPSPERLRRGFALVALLMIAGAIAFGWVVKGGTSPSNTTSIEMRTAIWMDSAQAASDHWLSGSGVGTFPQVYRRYEDPSEVGRTWINHAHNDYLELALETGVPGILLLIAFLGWWAARAGRAWRSATASYHAQAASIASATLLLHSLVDYPLRTAALSAVMAMCLALLAQTRRAEKADQPGELRPTRHRSI